MFQIYVGAIILKQVQCIFPQLWQLCVKSVLTKFLRYVVLNVWYQSIPDCEKNASMAAAKFKQHQSSGWFLSSFLADFLAHSTSRLKVIFKCWWTIKDVNKLIYTLASLQACTMFRLKLRISFSHYSHNRERQDVSLIEKGSTPYIQARTLGRNDWFAIVYKALAFLKRSGFCIINYCIIYKSF